MKTLVKIFELLILKLKESSFFAKLLFFIVLAIIVGLLLTSCKNISNESISDPVSIAWESSDSLQIEQLDSIETVKVKLVNNKEENFYPPIKIVVDADKSLSLNNGYFPKVTSSELLPIIDYIKKYGGELFLGLVQNRSRADLISFRWMPHNVAPPIQKRGERASDFRRRLIEFHQTNKQRLTSQVNVDTLEKRFLRDADKLLDYSELESSDICGAVGLAHMLVTEKDDELFDAKRVIIACTDGLNTTEPCKWVADFPNTDFIMVSRSGIGSNDLSRYKPIHQSSFAAAIRTALN